VDVAALKAWMIEVKKKYSSNETAQVCAAMALLDGLVGNMAHI
jgi:hypothetical protein